MRKLIICFCFLINLTFVDAQNDSQKDSLLNIGTYHWEQSEIFFAENYDSSFYHTTQANHYFKAAQAWELYILSYSVLSNLYYRTGDYTKYLDIAKKTIKEAERYLGQENKAYGYAQNNLAIFLMRKGDYNEAIKLYKNSLAIQEQSDSLVKSSIIVSRVYKNLGNAYKSKKDFLEALRYFQKAIPIIRKSKKSPAGEIASHQFDIGHCYLSMNQQDSAFVYYQKSLATLNQIQSQKSDYIKTLKIKCHQGLAKINLEQNQKDNAFFHLNRANDIQTIKGLRKPLTLQLLGEYYRIDDPQKSLQYLQKAIQVFNEKYKKNPKHKSLTKLYSELAKTHSQREDHLASLNNYQTALQKLAYDFDSNDHFKNPQPNNLLLKADALDIFDGKAQSLKQLYQQEQNLDYLKSAHQCYQIIKTLIRDLRNDYLATGSKHLLAASAISIYENAIENSITLYQKTNEQHYLEDAFDSAESNKALFLLESLNEQNARQKSEIPDSLLQQENELAIDIAFYYKNLLKEKQKGAKANTEKIEQWESLHFDLQKKHQELIAHLEKNYPKYYVEKYNYQSVDLQGLRQALEDKKLLLEYFVGEENIYLFQISQGDFAVRVLPKEDAFLNSIQDFRQLAIYPPNGKTAEKDFQQFTQMGSSLFEALLAPELKDRSAIRSLVIIPDPVLALLPFELLLHKKETYSQVDYGPAQLPYLLKKYAISYDYSANIFIKNTLQKQRPFDQTFAGFAPSFSNAIAMENRSCLTDQLYSLQCSETEINNIQQLFGGEALAGIDASKSRFQAEAKNYQILHLATHACIDEDNPILNRIYFTDGFLSSYELSNLQLNADLAVLSACNTGAGKLVKGEGVMSLARTFIEAGCPSTVMSLWPINDCSTSAIMEQFYQYLKKGQSKNEALQNAKLSYLSTASKEERHPYYWAAFVQFGKVAPIDRANRLGFSFWLSALLLGGFSLFLFSYFKNRT